MKRALLLLCWLTSCASASAPSQQWAAPAPAPVEPAPTTSTVPLTSEPAPAPAPSLLVPLAPPKPPVGAIWPPPGWTPPPCELETTAVVKRIGARFQVSAFVRNLTRAKLEFSTPDHCPQGPANFGGLPEHYDYYGACAAGACISPRPELHYSLAPGQSLQLVSITIDPQRTSCNAPLSTGQYLLGFGLQTKHLVCAAKPGLLDIAEPKAQPAARPTKPKICPPGPTCGIACPGGRQAHDANGCTVCGCEKESLTQ